MKKHSWSLVSAVVLLGACSQPVVKSGGDNGSGTGSSGSGSGSSGSGSGSGVDFSVPDGGAATGGTPTPSQTGGTPTATNNCGQKTFSLEKRPAELMLILDRSGSMDDPADPAAMTMTSKWTDVTTALNTTIMKTEALVQWGLKAFPTGGVRCGVNDGVEVPSAANNYTNVWNGIMMNAPGMDSGGTPTTIAIQKTVAFLNANPSMNPRYLVLATDGEPNCAMSAGGMGGGRNGRGGGGGAGAADDMAAIQAVKDAQTAGYKTFVIGVATGADAESVLNGMATAGGEARTGGTQTYYPVANSADLANALGVITGLVSDCVFHLDKAPPSPNDVAVDVNGARVSKDTNHMNGWDYGAANQSIQFYGAACDQVKNGAGQNVNIIFGCPGVVIN